VDSSTTFVLDFQQLGAQAVLSCSITLPPPPSPLVMRFRGGNILVAGPIFCPSGFTIQRFSKPGSGDVVEENRKVFASSFPGGGWHFQADEVARCIRDKQIESKTWGLGKTLLQMEIFDLVRKQGGYALPQGVEKVL